MSIAPALKNGGGKGGKSSNRKSKASKTHPVNAEAEAAPIDTALTKLDSSAGATEEANASSSEKAPKRRQRQPKNAQAVLSTSHPYMMEDHSVDTAIAVVTMAAAQAESERNAKQALLRPVLESEDAGAGAAKHPRKRGAAAKEPASLERSEEEPAPPRAANRRREKRSSNAVGVEVDAQPSPRPQGQAASKGNAVAPRATAAAASAPATTGSSGAGADGKSREKSEKKRATPKHIVAPEEDGFTTVFVGKSKTAAKQNV